MMVITYTKLYDPGAYGLAIFEKNDRFYAFKFSQYCTFVIIVTRGLKQRHVIAT
jgi:hypothetical protein